MAKSKALELSIKIAGKVDKSLTAAINDTNTMLGSITTAMSRVGTVGLATMGAMATATITGLSKCADEAQALETAMAPVVRYAAGLTDESNNLNVEAYRKMRAYIQDLSTEIPRTTTQIAEMSAALGQSGISAEEQMTTGILRDTAIAATAMDLDDQTAGEYMAKWEEAFGYNHDEVMELMDWINYLGATNATTAAEIAQSVNQSASVGQLAGIDPSVTAAIATAMQATGVSTDRVGTTITRIYTNISKGASATAAQKEMWQELGFTAEGVAKAMQTDGVGTLKSVFAAVNALPEERKLATLNTLFNQWAVEGSAKVTQNLDLLERLTDEAGDESLYSDSMVKEFIIEAGTSESIDTMLDNARTALMQDIGEAMLPVKKAYGTAMIDFYNTLRSDTPELQELTGTLETLATNGIGKLTDAAARATPYIAKGLSYLASNGGEVAATVGKIAAAFAAMKLAPAAGNLLSGSGGGLLGGMENLFFGGQRAAGFALNIAREVAANGLLTSLAAAGTNLRGTGAGRLALGAWQYVSSVFGALGGQGAATRRFFGSVGVGAQSLFGALFGKKNGLASLWQLVSGTSPLSLGEAGRGLLTSGAGLLGSVGGTLGSIYGPVLGGFGSLVTGALPVVGAISAIIAVVSILGDHLDDIRGVVESVFGERGVAVFNQFTGALETAGSFITGLFADGGVASALAPLRETLFGEGGIFAGSVGGAAVFDGLVTILQSVMGVAGQVVSFATGTVKPIILRIFEFLTGTVFPTLGATFSSAAPFVAGIISGVGSAVMTAITMIAEGIDFLLPIVEAVISVLLHIGEVVVPAVLAAVSAFSEGFGAVLGGAKTILEGVITFLTGVFSRKWSEAWEGLKSIFGGIFETLGALFKTPINAVIALINKAIDGVNDLGLDIPEWVPLIGGEKFSIDIPRMELLKYGGFTTGPSIAGEAGMEAVISFQRSARLENLAIWRRAGELLGVKPAELREIPDGDGENDNGGGGGGIVFAPQITIQGSADRETVDAALREAEARFEAWYRKMRRLEARTAY